MSYIIVIMIWLTISTSLVYWDMSKGHNEPLSSCHRATVKMYYDYKVGHDRPMCIDCKLFCEIEKP